LRGQKRSMRATPPTELTGPGFTKDQAYALETCARCGFCKPVCPTYPFGGGFEAFSPRAKVHFLRELRAGRAELTSDWVDRLFRCTTCARCVSVCQTSIPLVQLWEAIRAETVERGVGPMPAHQKLSVFAEQTGNPYGEPTEQRVRWMLPEHQPAEEAELMVFGGCTASLRLPSLLQIGVTLLQRQNIPYTYAGTSERCCASVFLRTGQLEMAKRLIAGNIDLIREKGVSQIVTPCGGCSKTLKYDYPQWARQLGKKWEVEVLHFSQVYLRLLESGVVNPIRTLGRTVTYHDPCHLGRAQGIFDEPRAILQALPGVKLVEMEYCREEARCCGGGGGVRANYPEMANQMARDRVMEAMETGADTLVTMCPFCQLSFDLVLKEMGYPLALAGLEDLLLESIIP